MHKRRFRLSVRDAADLSWYFGCSEAEAAGLSSGHDALVARLESGRRELDGPPGEHYPHAREGRRRRHLFVHRALTRVWRAEDGVHRVRALQGAYGPPDDQRARTRLVAHLTVRLGDWWWSHLVELMLQSPPMLRCNARRFREGVRHKATLYDAPRQTLMDAREHASLRLAEASEHYAEAARVEREERLLAPLLRASRAA